MSVSAALNRIWGPNSFSSPVPVSPPQLQHHGAAPRAFWGPGPVGFLYSRKQPGIDKKLVLKTNEKSTKSRSAHATFRILPEGT